MKQTLHIEENDYDSYYYLTDKSRFSKEIVIPEKLYKRIIDAEKEFRKVQKILKRLAGDE